MVSLIVVLVLAFGSLLATLTAGWSPKLGLDLAGGLSAIYKPAHKASLADLTEVTSILANRVNGLGVSGAEVNVRTPDGIQVVARDGIEPPPPAFSGLCSSELFGRRE